MQLYELDPMGRTSPPKGAPPTWQPYTGELINQTDLDPALVRNGAGQVRAIWATRGSAIGSGVTLPAGTSLARAEIDFYSERYTGRPFDNCLICSSMTVLRWSGINVPDGYDDVIRKAAGVPDPQGTTFEEVMRGIDHLFPGHPLHSGAVDEQALISSLKVVGKPGRGKAVYAVVVQTGKLPPHYQRLVGQGYDGLHGWALVAKQP